MSKPLTEAQKRISNDLARHASQRMVTAMADAMNLCPDRRMRAGIALQCLMHVFGSTAAAIDQAERRVVTPGSLSPEAYGLMMSVLTDCDPSTPSPDTTGANRGQ